jgi:YVTN family beta-propeller protein
VISPDAGTAYIASFGTCGASPGNLVKPIDLSVSPPVEKPPIALGAIGAFGVAISPDGRTVYASGCGKVVPIDVSASPATLGTPIDVPADPFSLVISRDGRTLWTANHSTGNVSVIDLSAPTPSVVKTITVGTQPLGLALTPDGTRLYVANGASCTISVIDTARETVSGAPIALPAGACTGTPQGYLGDPGRMVMSPDGATLYAASRDKQVVTPISTATNTAGAPISFTGVTTPTGQPFMPGGMAMTPDGARLLVADSGDGPQFGNSVQIVATPANVLSGSPIALNSPL